jgi:hypothetical protein
MEPGVCAAASCAYGLGGGSVGAGLQPHDLRLSERIVEPGSCAATSRAYETTN